MRGLRKIFLIFILLLSPVFAFGFEIKDIANYSAVGLKVLVQSDTAINDNRLIQSTKDLQRILGEAKAQYTAQYVYKGTYTELEESGSATWYAYFPPSYKGRSKCKLYYDSNNIMRSSVAGDTLVLAKKSDNEILLLIVQHDSPAEKELYSVLGMTAPEKQAKSWWKKLWSSSSKTETEYDIDADAVQMPKMPEKSWARIYFTPGLECENNIVSSIDSALKTIDVAVYSITNDKIVDSLIAAHNRGVTVRVISDRLQSAGRASLIGRIQDAGIPVVLNKKHKIMHNKFAIFDAKDIETGSYNWTSAATQSNAENCMFFPQQDKVFTRQFKYLWGLYQK